MDRGEHLREILEQPLDHLRDSGLARPPSLSLTRYLELLSRHELIAPDAAARYLELYHRTVHGGQTADPNEVEMAATRLVDTLDPPSERLSAAARELTVLAQPVPPAAPAPKIALPPVAVLSIDSLNMPAWEPDQQNAAPFSPPVAASPHWHQRWSVRTAVFILYSLALVTTGYLAAPWIAKGLESLAYHAFGAVRSGDVDALRERAASEPENIALWQQWARHAERRGRWAEAVLAHRHMVARRPNDPNLLNAFAWFLCTAEEPWARDPVQALELAQRAYALDPAPHITDTLAEAAFQTGDAERAVALEKDAIRRLNGNNAFYQRQLSKFEAALPREERPKR